MFRSARIKLTAWYLLFIMLVSFSFSLVIYRMATFELKRIERMQRLRLERQLPESAGTTPPNNNLFLRPLEPELIIETKNRLKMLLAFINLGILVISTGGGYWLAGRTLKPIKEMLDEQNQFVTNASHELRTPLTSLKTEIEVNLRNRKLTLTEAKKLLKSNLEEVNSLQALSDRLIKLAQFQKKDNNFAFTKVNLGLLSHEAIKKVSNLAKNKNITIVNKIRGELTIEGNRQALLELLVIFLDNAIKYSPKKTKINLSSEKTNGYAEICIADQGIGIDKEDLPHLFDQFYQATKSRTKSETAGYGLGLSIAKQIVDKHRGFIKVQSELGKGSIFTIQLPLKQSYKLA